MNAIRTIIAHPDGGNLYGSPCLFRDASYAFTLAYSRADLARDGWRMVELADMPDALRLDAAELTPGEYVDDRGPDEDPEHEVDHNACDRDEHLARVAGGVEDCPLVACLWCDYAPAVVNPDGTPTAFALRMFGR